MSHVSHLHQPQSDDGTTAAYGPGSPTTAMKVYDPNDPTTYPGYHGVPASTGVSVLSYDGGMGGNTPANMQTARTQGYHGLPIV